MIIKLSTILLGLIYSLGMIRFTPPKDEYTFAFYKIDNKVNIIINDSLVFTSGEFDQNPDLEGNFTSNITRFLTDEQDEVTIQLYNGFEPYPKDQKDQHWEIEYSLFKNGEEIDLMWNEGDDFKTGLVFEAKYYF